MASVRSPTHYVISQEHVDSTASDIPNLKVNMIYLKSKKYVTTSTVSFLQVMIFSLCDVGSGEQDITLIKRSPHYDVTKPHTNPQHHVILTWGHTREIQNVF